MTRLGRVLFAVGFALRGALVAGRHGYILWQLLSKTNIWLESYLAVSGVVMLAGGVALLFPRAVRPAAIAVGACVLLQILVLIVPQLAQHPELLYESMGEQAVFIAAAWAIYSLSPRADGSPARFSNLAAARVLYALALLPIGLSHVLAMNLTAPLIPSWLPWHVSLAYFTGAAHIAAGIGILLGIVLAATLEAVMMSLFTVVVWIPLLITAPERVFNWSEIFSSVAISGAAWVIAGSFRKIARLAVVT